MQTMTALLRIGGSLEMTVAVRAVTPAEALLLMHIHDPSTKDAFEGAVLSNDVQRSKTDERLRLHEAYPRHAGLIDHLFPGRNATDVPTTFAELEDVPLEVAKEAKKAKARAVDAAAVEVVNSPADQAYPTMKVKAQLGQPSTPGEKLRAVMGEDK